MSRRHPAMGPSCVRALLAVAVFLGAATAARADQVAVIVHPKHDRLRLEVETLAQIYLKQRRFWRDGSPIVPINREAGSPVRELFSRRVLGRSAERLRTYWNRRYFQGVLPPPTLASDEAVLRYVAGEPRAIGYVRSGALDASVRVVFAFEER